MSKNPIDSFIHERDARIAANGEDKAFLKLSNDWSLEALRRQYTYNFEWMGRPIIQYPQDIMIMQELFWKVQPDVIIETGVAHGGSIIFAASMLALMGKKDAFVIGIDIDIRAHNREAIEQHPMASRIKLVEGSSIDDATIAKVKALLKPGQKILVVLDSMHTHDHVLKEMQLYGPLVSQGSYMVVEDTVVEEMPEHLWQDRPWAKGNNPMTAVHAFIKTSNDFEMDTSYEQKAMITCSRNGFLRRR